VTANAVQNAFEATARFFGEVSQEVQIKGEAFCASLAILGYYVSPFAVN
jgi:hypothetical protein